MEVNKLLDPLMDDGKSILIMMHSFGGAVGSNAIPPACSAGARASKNLPSGIAGLVCICAFMLQLGQSTAQNVHYDYNPIQVAESWASEVGNPDENFDNGAFPTQMDQALQL